MGSFFDTVGGIPMHPLVVHVVVILIPMSALGAVLMVARRSFSRRYASVVTIVSAVAAVAAIVAKESGEQLSRHLTAPNDHVDLGSKMPYVAGALFLLIAAYWLVDRGIPMNRPRPLWLGILGVVVVLVAIFSVYWTFLVGHSGTEAVWSSLLSAQG